MDPLSWDYRLTPPEPYAFCPRCGDEFDALNAEEAGEICGCREGAEDVPARQNREEYENAEESKAG